MDGDFIEVYDGVLDTDACAALIRRFEASASCTRKRTMPPAKRCTARLLWTVYLNDRFAEGETEFLHQQRKIAPKTGSLLIAPAAFTHTHRGNMPKGGAKYIATSWVLFRREQA